MLVQLVLLGKPALNLYAINQTYLDLAVVLALPDLFRKWFSIVNVLHHWFVVDQVGRVPEVLRAVRGKRSDI
jgi:hypothetical protein